MAGQQRPALTQSLKASNHLAINQIIRKCALSFHLDVGPLNIILFTEDFILMVMSGLDDLVHLQEKKIVKFPPDINPTNSKTLATQS